MARISKVETCFICEKAPCECGKVDKPKASKTKAPRVEKVKTSVEQLVAPAPPRSGPSMRDRMKAAAEASAQQAPVSTPTPPVTPSVKPQPRQLPTNVDDLIFASAVRALAPILHPDEVARYDVLIHTTETPVQRAAVWRARREGAQ